MRLIPGERYLFDTTVFRDFTYRRQTAVELIRQAGEPNNAIYYSFVTFWELKVSDSKWSEDEQYILLKPFPMIGLHPDIGELAEHLQQLLQEQNMRRKDKLSLPEFNDCYIAAAPPGVLQLPVVIPGRVRVQDRVGPRRQGRK